MKTEPKFRHFRRTTLQPRFLCLDSKGNLPRDARGAPQGIFPTPKAAVAYAAKHGLIVTFKQLPVSEPFATLVSRVAINNPEIVVFALSRCNIEDDRFSKKEGRRRARERLRQPENSVSASLEDSDSTEATMAGLFKGGSVLCEMEDLKTFVTTVKDYLINRPQRVLELSHRST